MAVKTKDIDVRKKLHDFLSFKLINDEESVLIHELGLCQGEARVDIAIVNGSLMGYEIKSDSDNLERLPGQIEIYNKVMDSVTIVTGKFHTEKVINAVPSWWGIMEAEKLNKEDIELTNVREPRKNLKIDPYSLVQLLWKEEALELLTTLGLEKGCLSKPRKVIWEKLVKNVSLEDLKSYVRQQLKFRGACRAVLQRM